VSNKIVAKSYCLGRLIVVGLISISISTGVLCSEVAVNERRDGIDRPEASLFSLGEKWIDQEGKPFAWKDNAYDSTILTMIYTTCASACSLSIQKMVAFQRKLPSAMRNRVRVVLFSFDPKRDTPSALKKFATSRKLDLSHVSLLTSNEEDARTLATVLDFRFKKLANGEFSHSNQITILNRNGAVVFQSSSLDAASESLLNKQNSTNLK
jgi:protein SCO1/2